MLWVHRAGSGQFLSDMFASVSAERFHISKFVGNPTKILTRRFLVGRLGNVRLGLIKLSRVVFFEILKLYREVVEIPLEQFYRIVPEG